MKAFLLFMFIWGSIANINAQRIYVPGKIVKGDSVSYYCKAKGKYFVEVRNVKNINTVSTIYYMDGTMVPESEENIAAMIGNSQKDLQVILREVLTDEEWEKIKGKVGFGLSLNVVAHYSGRTQELSMIFRSDDPVLSFFAPDRLYQLEQRFKRVIRLIWNDSGKQMRNAKYPQSIFYGDLE